MQQNLIWFLRILVVIQSLGYAAKLAAPSALNSYLLGSMGGSFVSGLDHSVWLFLLFSSAALLVLGFLRPAASSVLGKVDFALLGLLALWPFTLAVFSFLNNMGDAFHATDPIGHAVRFAAPLALILLGFNPNPLWQTRVDWLLRLSVAGAFIGHGLCAWWIKPSFIDLIVGTLDTLLGQDLAASASRQVFAEASLPVIAVQDFILVALLLLPNRKIRTVAMWMAIWGFVTAMSRMTAYGWGNWHDLALRICNGGIPLFLWYSWKQNHTDPTHS
ncbi:MAG: hypothetical protein CMI33_09985 [Opitutales bacterium]|nr:hypothetical protein [Opitutales bacterium]